MLKQEKGLTLIEVMTAIVLFAMITTILYSFLFMGISMYKRVAAEAQLRSQVNVFYSQLLGFFEKSVYAYKGTQENEIIVIKKEGLTGEQDADTSYIRYFSVIVNADDETIRYTPVTGGGAFDRDVEKQVVRTLDSEQFDLEASSKMTLKPAPKGQFVVVDLTFTSKKRGNNSKENSTIRIKTEIPISQ
jgi:prepilin-type N-terminal cleavage/methylation domain-containing protein